MKVLNTTAGQFGPFNSIAQSEDRWVCDGVEYQFSVIGDATIVGYVAPPSPPPIIEVPQSVSMRQARLALLSADLLASVNSAIAAGSEAAQIEWEFASEVMRSSPLVSGLASALNLTETQIDGLFVSASQY